MEYSVKANSLRIMQLPPQINNNLKPATTLYTAMKSGERLMSKTSLHTISQMVQFRTVLMPLVSSSMK